MFAALLIGSLPSPNALMNTAQATEEKWKVISPKEDVELVTESGEQIVILKKDSRYYASQVNERLFFQWNSEKVVLTSGLLEKFNVTEDTLMEGLEIDNPKEDIKVENTGELSPFVYEQANSESPVIAQIPINTNLNIIGEENSFKVVLLGNKKGYISFETLQPIDDDPKQDSEQLNEDSKHKESEDGSNSEEEFTKEKALIIANEEVDKVKQNESIKPDKVETKSKSSTSAFNGNHNIFKVKSNNLSIYLKINGKLVSVGKLKSGQVYQRVADLGNWHQIKFGNSYGYVWEQSTEPISNFQLDGLPTGKSNKSLKTKKSTLIYSKQGNNLIHIGTINSGVDVKVIKDYGAWISINFSGIEGFVYKDNIELTLGSSDYFTVINKAPVYLKSGNNLVV